MPLLHIRPHYLVRNGYEAEGERWCGSSATDVCVPGDNVLGSNLDERSGLSFHPFGIGLISVRVLKENSITAADGSFAVSETDPRQSQCAERG